MGPGVDLWTRNVLVRLATISGLRCGELNRLCQRAGHRQRPQDGLLIEQLADPVPETVIESGPRRRCRPQAVWRSSRCLAFSPRVDPLATESEHTAFRVR